MPNFIEIVDTHIQLTLRCDCGHTWDIDDSDSMSIDSAISNVSETCPQCENMEVDQ